MRGPRIHSPLIEAERERGEEKGRGDEKSVPGKEQPVKKVQGSQAGERQGWVKVGIGLLRKDLGVLAVGGGSHRCTLNTTSYPKALSLAGPQHKCAESSRQVVIPDTEKGGWAKNGAEGMGKMGKG